MAAEDTSRYKKTTRPKKSTPSQPVVPPSGDDTMSVTGYGIH